MEKNNEKKPKIRFFILALTIIALLTSIFAIYNIFLLSSIEDGIRYVVIGIFALIDLILIFRARARFKPKKKKKPKNSVFITLTILYIIFTAIISVAITYLYGKIDGVNKKYVTYSSSLLVMSSNEAKDVKDIKNYKIALLNNENSPDGYIIPQEIIKDEKLKSTNEIIPYDNYSTMLVDLYTGELDAIFISSSYESMFSEITDYENIKTDTKVIIEKEKRMKKSDTSTSETESSGKSLNEPFTMLLMGIDSTDEVLSKNAIANGDTLILITFNPKTLNATMVSIPRDSYVPIACWPGKQENKITHAAGYGTDCMMNTIEDYLDIDIDYYAKINFKGLVKLVDAVGGVDVEVPKKLCTDDSNRGQEVCINEGFQTLNGEQALVFARNRKALENGDFGRAAHQQEIVRALMNKVRTINDVSTFMNILNTISNSLDTNLTTKQILSFYNVGKDVLKKSSTSTDTDIINIQQLYLQGQGAMIYDKNMRMTLYNYVINTYSKKDVIHAMKENLGLVEHTVIKEFEFSINDPYVKTVIGEGPYSSSGITTKDSNTITVPNFTGDSQAQAQKWANNNGLVVHFIGSGGTVVSQSVSSGTSVKTGTTVTLTLSGNSTNNNDNNSNTNSNNNNNSTNPGSNNPNNGNTGDNSSNSGDDSGGNNSSGDDSSGSGTGSIEPTE